MHRGVSAVLMVLCFALSGCGSRVSSALTEQMKMQLAAAEGAAEAEVRQEPDDGFVYGEEAGEGADEEETGGEAGGHDSRLSSVLGEQLKMQLEAAEDTALVGRWIPADMSDGYVDFGKDGMFEIGFEGDTLQLEWHIRDDELILSQDGEEMAMSYSLEDQNHLYLDGELLIREGFQEAQKAVDHIAASSYFQQMAGAWYLPGSGSASFILYDDGTCEISGEYGLGSWGVVNGNIFKLSNYYGETETAQIDYIGDGRLEISGYGNTQTFYNKPNQP